MDKKQILRICVAVVLAACLVTVVVCDSVVFSNPANTPDDRISQGVVPTKEDLNAANIYDRVVIVGIDGAGGTFERFNTPNFDRIFQTGSVNLNGMAQYPTMSGANWASMFLGVTAQKHNITNAKAGLFANKEWTSVFGLCAKAYSGSTFFSCVSWTQINHGVIENDVPGLTKVNAKEITKGDDFDIDKMGAEKVAARAKTHDDKIVFVLFDCVDHAGHKHGNQSKEYRKAMEKADEFLGMVYDAYMGQDKGENTLFICVSDHGHTAKGGHGKESASEKQTTLALTGKTVINGISGAYVTHDLAAIVLYALGIEQPTYFDGGVPTNIFTTLAEK